VTLTLLAGFVLADVSPSAAQAITDYINSVPVGGTVYRAGIYDAVFGLPGIATLVVTHLRPTLRWRQLKSPSRPRPR
jgi:hypothetical protein